MQEPASFSGMPTQDDRIMAAVCHGAILLSLPGLAVPIIIWALQKDKSRFVAFQAIQAAAFQLARMVANFLWGICYFVSFFGSMFMTTSSSSRSYGFPAAMLVPFASLGLLGLLELAFTIYAFVGLAMAAQGKEFRYFLIGDWVERFVSLS